MVDKRLLITLLCLLAGRFIGGPTAAAAQAPPRVVIDHEYEYKAAYLYHFARLCDWPDRETIVVGVLGPNRFGRQLRRIEDQSRNLAKRINTVVFSSIDQYRPCQLLFVAGRDGGRETQARLRQALERTNGQATLIITENRDFAAQGAAVNFYIENNRLKMLINLAAVRRAGVEIPPELLRLRSVRTVPGDTPGR